MTHSSVLKVFMLLIGALSSFAMIEAHPIVDLSYGSFRGAASQSGVITSFLGIPYARAPIGKLRFAPPERPNKLNGVQDATTYGAACPQQDQGVHLLHLLFYNLPLPVQTKQSEDCLSVNVIKPSNISGNSKLPVVFWIFPGGFEIGNSADNPGFTAVERSIALGEPIIHVSANYRISALGFLPGREALSAGLANAGLRDQRFALHWVHDNIASFGGDPAKVTLWGESAGAISVGLQLLLSDGNPHGLFRGAFMQSGSPTYPIRDMLEGQRYYDRLVEQTNCSGAADTLQCLRDAPYEKLMAAVNRSPGFFTFETLRLAWQPRIDGNILKRSPFESIENGQYAKVPLVSGACDDEGTVFAFHHMSINSNDDFLQYIQHNYLEGSSSAEIKSIGEAYPEGFSKGSPFDTENLNAVTTQYKRLAAFKGDIAFHAPRRFLLEAASKTQDAWSYLYKRGKWIPIFGALHYGDVADFYGVEGLSDFAGTDAVVYFVNSLNPTRPKNNVSHLSGIKWDQWGSSASHPQLTFLDGEPRLAITHDTFRVEQMRLLSRVSANNLNKTRANALFENGTGRQQTPLREELSCDACGSPPTQ